MARRPRLYSLVEDGFYHVIARGNNEKSIFREASDYLRWKNYLLHYKNEHKAKLLAYVLMPNHYHLLLKVGPHLPKLMSGFNTRNAMYFNRKYQLSGHLFQGRYKSYLVAEDPYLITLIRYIHNNPVRANLVKNALSYEHSSLNDYHNNGDLTDTRMVEKLIETRARGTLLSKILS